MFLAFVRKLLSTTRWPRGVGLLILTCKTEVPVAADTGVTRVRAQDVTNEDRTRNRLAFANGKWYRFEDSGDKA